MSRRNRQRISRLLCEARCTVHPSRPCGSESSVEASMDCGRTVLFDRLVFSSELQRRQQHVVIFRICARCHCSARAEDLPFLVLQNDFRKS